MVAEVIVNLGGNDLLDYRIPKEYHGSLEGKRVVVEIGRKEYLGLVKKVKMESSFTGLKEIIAILDEKPVISQELLELHSYISDYYLTPLSRVIELSFPENSKIKKKKIINILAGENERQLLSEQEKKIVYLAEEKKVSYFQIQKDFELHDVFENMQRNGFAELKYSFELPKTSSMGFWIIFLKNAEKDFKKDSNIQKLYEFLNIAKKISLEDLKKQNIYDQSALRQLIKKELVAKEEGIIEEKIEIDNENLYKNRTLLTEEQEKALFLIKNENKPTLLFGITGSGKTEIYIEMMREFLEKGQSVLYMVPEISLVNQTISRIKDKIDKEILSWHSNMSDKEKLYSWEKLQLAMAHIVVGARSAVFAPIKNLGLIIVDEEHETSYKQNEPDPRYNGVDAALKRAELSGAKIILGSATPSLQRYYKGVMEEYQVVTLKKRPVNARLPKVEIVDLKEEFKKGNRSVFSRNLENRIFDTLRKKEQVILFLNRRGFSRFILCRECGHVITCSKCSVPLILHKSPDILKCHYCEEVTSIPTKCPECSSKFIKDMGMGTQKIETLLYEKFPGVKVTRLDQDQIKNKDSYENLLSEFSRGESDILLGTQMVVKGLDFSNVTLVGIISADLSLNVPDLYSAERTFQLLTQVAGRAGRGDLEGYVVIQTYNPDHFSIIASKSHNFESFYHQELQQRKIMDYPPFTKMIRILVSGENKEKTKETIENLAIQLKGILKNEEILGPGEAPINRIKNRYRYHLIIKTKDNFLHNYLKENYNKLKTQGQKQGMRILFDVDPYLIL